MTASKNTKSDKLFLFPSNSQLNSISEIFKLSTTGFLFAYHKLALIFVVY